MWAGDASTIVLNTFLEASVAGMISRRDVL